MSGLLLYGFFFFKQKTAYEMRISDWSSDVCSSDLGGGEGGVVLRQLARRPGGELAVLLEPDHGVAVGVGPAHARVAVEQAMAIAVGGDHQQAAAEPGVAVAEALGEPGVPGGGAGGTMAQGGEHAHAGGQEIGRAHV